MAERQWRASLAWRLVVSAAVWSALVLALAGITLSSVYRGAVERGFDQRLTVYLKALIADLATPQDLEKATFAVGEPRFELPLSGWYWQIGKLGGGQFKVSRSLFDRELPFLIEMDPVKDQSVARESYVEGPAGTQLRQLERVIDLGDRDRYVVAVAGDATDINDAIADFQFALFVTFALLFIGLIGAAFLQVRWGLRPVKALSSGIGAIRAGTAERLNAEVPRELEPLAAEVNALLAENRGVVERARTQVGNLAHALKTPLSVMLNEADAKPGALADKVREQAGIMRAQVDHHLERARIAAGVSVAASPVDVPPVLSALVRTMERVHGEKSLSLALEAEPVQFRGDRQDLEEMAGNLIDNACKWARSRISVRAVAEPGQRGARSFLRISVEDDGPGLSAEQREAMPRRGLRLDESKPGSGLGLSIVADLAELYGGRLTLAEAEGGGLRAEIRLPAAAAR